MTDDAEPLAWRASARRIAGVGWLLGAVGGTGVVVAYALAGWGQSVEAGLSTDPALAVLALLFGIPMGGPVGGAGGIWGAAIVVALRGRRPPVRRAERRVRLAVAAALLAVGVAAAALLDVGDWLAHMGGAVPSVAIAVLGTVAIGWIVVVGGRVRPGGAAAVEADGAVGVRAVDSDADAVTDADEDAAEGAPPASPPSGRTPLVLGAALGPLAVIAMPLAAALASPYGSSLTATNSGLLVLFGLGLGPLVGMTFAAIASMPWGGSDDWPGSMLGRVAVTVGVQLVTAAFLAFVGHLLLSAQERSIALAVGGGVVLLVVQLALLAVAWRSHARHAEDLSRSR